MSAPAERATRGDPVDPLGGPDAADGAFGARRAGGASRATALAGIAAHLDLWRARSADAEADGRLGSETADELAATGAHRLLQPAAHGGAASSFVDHLDAVAAVGEACASASWCLAVWSVHNWMLARFDAAAQRDVWGDDPAARISASIVPRNRFERSAGGVIVHGRFPFASGCDHASWFLLSGVVEAGDEPGPVMVLVPRHELTIDHGSWDVMGLRGTGSKDVVVESSVEVPAYRTVSYAALATGAAPGSPPPAEPLHRAPFRPVAVAVLAPPVLGAARAALRRFVERIDRRLTVPGGGSQRHDPAAGLRLAESSAEIDAAGLVMAETAHQLDRMGHDASVDAVAAARIARDTAFATRLATRAVDRLFEAAGGSALQLGEPLQRAWRDVHAARTHAVLTWDNAANAYAQAVLGG
ncbi:MAG: acyl-CoA dehydrogenase family protein [Acidimicrobiia bacterium]|nr:acyl-CoA dehydrogenase family protein [Acidimicrobiia bacterium]